MGQTDRRTDGQKNIQTDGSHHHLMPHAYTFGNWGIINSAVRTNYAYTIHNNNWREQIY